MIRVQSESIILRTLVQIRREVSLVVNRQIVSSEIRRTMGREKHKIDTQSLRSFAHPARSFARIAHSFGTLLTARFVYALCRAHQFACSLTYSLMEAKAHVYELTASTGPDRIFLCLPAHYFCNTCLHFTVYCVKF